MTVPVAADLMDITSDYFENESIRIRYGIPRIGPTRLRSMRKQETSV